MFRLSSNAFSIQGRLTVAVRVGVKPEITTSTASSSRIYRRCASQADQDSGKIAAPAPALEATAVVDARFCEPESTAFAVTKISSVTGRDFTVTDITGAAVMQVEAAVFAFQRRSLLLDGAARRPLLTMRDSGLFMSTRWEVFVGDSTSGRNLLFTVVKSSAFQIRTKIYVFLAGNAGERAPDFVIRGSYYEGACTVSPGNSDAAIAQITSQNTVGGALLGRHTYTARINAGIDRAFILALTVILDEMHHRR